MKKNLFALLALLALTGPMIARADGNVADDAQPKPVHRHKKHHHKKHVATSAPDGTEAVTANADKEAEKIRRARLEEAADKNKENK